MESPDTTERIYYQDCYRSRFDGVLKGWSEDGAAILDRTAFYPSSGGQDPDMGWLGGVRVVSVEEHAGVVWHRLESPMDAALQAGATVEGQIDWPRRFDLMQHHTGQHLVSAVAHAQFGWETASVHLGAQRATVEFAVESATPEQLEALEQLTNEAIAENHPVGIRIVEEGEPVALRKATARSGPLRVVSIGDIDHSACGGTHVRSTAEIGAFLIVGTERVRKQLRVEFACGGRAMAQARQQRDLLRASAAVWNCRPDQLPEILAQQKEDSARLNKLWKGASKELQERRGRSARLALALPEEGLGPVVALRWISEAPGDDVRAFANGFCSIDASVLLQVHRESGAFLVASAAQGGCDAGAWLKQHAAALQAKGGGNALQANGRLANAEAVPQLLTLLPAAPILLSED